jgi:hypothetical protein
LPDSQPAPIQETGIESDILAAGFLDSLVLRKEQRSTPLIAPVVARYAGGRDFSRVWIQEIFPLKVKRQIYQRDHHRDLDQRTELPVQRNSTL